MHLLQEITVIATVSVLVTLILGRLKLPVVAGLVLSGALVGPNALSLAHDPEAIEVIAEVGVIFLLFTIGLEFSLARLRNIFRQVALGGLIQVSVTALVTFRNLYRFWSLHSTGNCIRLCLCLIQYRLGSSHPWRAWRIRRTPWTFYCGYLDLPGSLHRSHGSHRSLAFVWAG